MTSNAALGIVLRAPVTLIALICIGFVHHATDLYVNVGQIIVYKIRVCKLEIC